MNKMKKKTNIRVFYIPDNKIQLLIKEKIRNFKNLLFGYFWEQLLRVKGILINYHVCIIVCLEMPFSKSSYHIGTSQQICIAIQFTVFYMIRVFTEKYFATDYNCSCYVKILETKQCRLFPKFVTSIMELYNKLRASIYSKQTQHIFEGNFPQILYLTRNFINQLSANFPLKKLREL